MKIDKDAFYLGMAFLAASKSKDPSTQIGAYIVSSDNFPLGWGYNGPPRLINDDEVNWERPFKYDYIRHAEENAIDHCCNIPEDSTIYVTAHPCKRCMLLLVAKKIKRVVYFDFQSDKNSSLRSEDMQISKQIAEKGGIILEQFSGNLNWLKDRIVQLESLGILSK